MARLAAQRQAAEGRRRLQRAALEEQLQALRQRERQRAVARAEEAGRLRDDALVVLASTGRVPAAALQAAAGVLLGMGPLV